MTPSRRAARLIPQRGSASLPVLAKRKGAALPASPQLAMPLGHMQVRLQEDGFGLEPLQPGQVGIASCAACLAGQTYQSTRDHSMLKEVDNRVQDARLSALPAPLLCR